MSRPSKPVQLRAVDELRSEPENVVRLVNSETDEFKDIEAPVILGQQPAAIGHKAPIVLPMREDLETRSHEPGVETIIDPESPPQQLLEDEWGDAAKNTKPIAWGYFALLGIAMTGAIVWSLTKIEKSAQKTQQIKEEATSMLSNEEEEQRKAERIIDQLDARVREFHNASSISDLLPLVRHPERVKPLMEHYYSTRPVIDKRLRSISSFHPLTLDKRADFWMVNVQQSGDRSSDLIIEINEEGEPLVDWETFVRYQPIEWTDYVKNRPEGVSMDFRVYVHRDNFFSNEFSDASIWTCFQLDAPDSEEFLYGYVRSDNPVAKQITNHIDQNGGNQAAMILRLHIPANLESKRGVVIEEMVCESWFFIEPPAPKP